MAPSKVRLDSSQCRTMQARVEGMTSERAVGRTEQKEEEESSGTSVMEARTCQKGLTRMKTRPALMIDMTATASTIACEKTRSSRRGGICRLRSVIWRSKDSLSVEVMYDVMTKPTR